MSVLTQAVAEVAAALNGQFKGHVLRPGDPEFSLAYSIWNGMVARTPKLVLRCLDTNDVQTAVRAASTAGVLTAVKCGGHSLAGFSSCDGGVVIDLSGMRHVSVDEAARRARVAGGCLLQTIDTATQRVRLAFPAGVVSHTGASGLILGGGTGWLTRRHGLSCDNVESFTLTTADGSLIRASHRENADLFWALRGGGGNFGIVVEFELKLYPISSVLIGSAWYVGREIQRVLRFWRDFMPEAHEELKWNISLTRAPQTAQIPERFHGRPALNETVVWFGKEEKGNRYLNRIFSFGHPVLLNRSVISYLALQTMADADFPRGARYYAKSGYFASLDDQSIDAMLTALSSMASAKSQIELSYLAGAAARVSPSETAFGDRSAPFILNLLGHWTEPHEDAANIAWIRTLFNSLRQRMKPGVYVNFMSADENDRTLESYRSNWERLLIVKRVYDPYNFFRLNQNICEHGAIGVRPFGPAQHIAHVKR